MKVVQVSLLCGVYCHHTTSVFTKLRREFASEGLTEPNPDSTGSHRFEIISYYKTLQVTRSPQSCTSFCLSVPVSFCLTVVEMGWTLHAETHFYVIYMFTFLLLRRLVFVLPCCDVTGSFSPLRLEHLDERNTLTSDRYF